MVLNLRSISNYQFIFGIIRRETQLVIQSIWGRKNSSNGINGDWRFSLITHVLCGDLLLNLIITQKTEKYSFFEILSVLDFLVANSHSSNLCCLSSPQYSQYSVQYWLDLFILTVFRHFNLVLSVIQLFLRFPDS